MTILNIQLSPFRKEHETTYNMLRKLQPADLEKSIDQGGHGGTVRIKKAINGQYLFLKPKIADGTEARNYKIINNNKMVARWMPKVYGEIRINGQSFLVMENIRKSNDGVELPQLADIKLAGKVKGLKKTIANSKEMRVTRGKTKSLTTKLWMKLVTSLSPGYLLTDGGIRLFDYINSKKILKRSLSSISTRHLHKLLADLTELRNDLKRSGIALIGASIVLIHLKDGSLRPVLIDPAHIQCSNALKGQISKTIGKQESQKVFYECLTSQGKNQYRLHKASNVIALHLIGLEVQKMLAKREAEEIAKGT